MQSLRNLKERRRAIAHQITAGVSKTLEAKLATQAMDIAYLKKERDQIISDREKEFNELKKQIEEKHDQTKRRLDDVEAVSARVPSLMDRTETLKLVNAAAKPLTERLEVLEKSDTGLPDLRKGLQDLAAVPETLATLESRQAAKPEPDQFNVFVKSELISIRDRLDSTLAKIHRLENDITTLKTAKELQGIDIGALKTWKDAQPKAVSEVTTNNLIAAQVKEKASVVLKTLSEKTDEANHKLAERFNDNKAEIRSHQLELQEFKSFKENYKQELANQLSVLYERVKTVEGNNAKTYAKADKLQNKLQKLENDLHKVEDDVDDLSPNDKLLDKVQEIREEMKSMNKDLLSFEKDFSDYQDDIVKYIGRIKSDYKDTRKSLSERVAALRTTLTEADLSRLPVRLSELEKSARNVDRLAVRVDELDKLPPRVDELERAPKGPNFKRVGTPVFPSSTVAKAPETGDLDSKVDSLDKSLQRLRKTVEGKNSLTSRMDRQEERIDSIEASSASARPLETVEQTVETEDRALDKTVEKAVEKRVKTLATEQKAAKNLEELKTRLIEEIRASRNKGHEQSAQFDMNALSVTQQGLETLQEKFEDHDAIISSIQEMVPNLFREHFAPLKASVEQQAQIISNTLDQHGHDIFNLNRQVANLPTQQNILGQQQQQAQLEGMVAEAVSLRTAFAALQTSLSRKVHDERMHQQLQGMNQQLQGITFALNNLQSRYENINTDDMYKRMVEWFTRQYPSVTQIQNEIKELRAAKMLADPHGSFIALSRDAESLHGLLRIAPQLRGLVDTKQAATSEGQIVNVSTAEIQRRLIEDANTLENLQNRLEEDKIERVTELEHLRFRVSDERRARADAEAEIKKTISNLFAIVSNNASTIKKETKECSDQLRQIKSDYEAAVPEIRDQLSNVQKAGAELRKEFDATVKAYIEPNRDLFGIMDNVITVVAQVQQILESVNQNLPKGPLKLDWVCYLPKHGQLQNNGELENNSEPSNSKGKGKSKQ
ncbi:unnamed protein product [Alternaria alternata]